LDEDHPFTDGAAEEWSDPENRKPKKQGQRGPRPGRGGSPKASAGRGGRAPRRR